jgi:C-terminal processing protease CtpA/Prc
MKTSIRFMLGFLIASTLLPSPGSFAEAPLSHEAVGQTQWTGSVEQKLLGLMTVWSEAKFNFPYFDRVSSLDWDQKVQEFIPRVLGADSLESYYEVLMEFAALLKDGHTGVTPPWMYAKPGHDHPPVELQVLEDRILVARTGDSEEVRKQRVYPGLEILEIDDGSPARTYLKEKVLRLNSRGTPQADEAIGLVGILSGPRNSRVLLKVKDRDGTVREVSLTRNSMERDGVRFQWRWVRWYMFDPVVEARMIRPGIFYVRISNFRNEKVVEEFEKAFDRLDLAGIQGIVVDIRYNSGGNSSRAYSIAGFLTDQPLKASKWKSISYVPAYRSWGRPMGWVEGGPAVVNPREGKRYLGPLVVLTGPGTFSAAEDFLVPLKYSGRAVLVGEKTAGSTGNPISVPLPGGGRFMVVSKRDAFPDGTEFVGVGISPDVPVHPTQEALFEGTDPVLDKAIDVVGNWVHYYRKQ